MFHAFGYQTTSALAIIDIGRNRVEIIHMGVIFLYLTPKKVQTKNIIELFRRNAKTYMLFWNKQSLTSSIFKSSEGQAELVNAGSTIKEMPGDIFFSNTTMEIITEVFHQISKVVYYMNEEILNTHGGHLA
jgi:hypothetical protein